LAREQKAVLWQASLVRRPFLPSDANPEVDRRRGLVLMSSAISGCKIRAMSNIDRRTLLYAFEITSVSSMLPARPAAAGKVAVAKPGVNRFAFGSAAQA